MGDLGGEFSGLAQTGTQESWDLSDDGIGGHERHVPLGQFLDQLFVLVQFLHGLNVHRIESIRLGFVAMSVVSQDTDLGDGSRDVGQLNGSGETEMIRELEI